MIGDPVAEFVEYLRAEHPAWTITVHPLGLGLWSAEHRSVDSRSIHYVVAHTGDELAGGLAVADQKIGS